MIEHQNVPSNPLPGGSPAGTRTSPFVPRPVDSSSASGATVLPTPCPFVACDEFSNHPWGRGGERFHRNVRTVAPSGVTVSAEVTEYINDNGAMVIERPVVVLTDVNGASTPGEAWLHTPAEVDAMIKALRDAALAAWGEAVGTAQTRPHRPQSQRGGATAGDMVLWTVHEVSAVTGYAESTVYKWARAGRIPARKVGRDVRFLPKDIDRWAERQRQGGR